MNRYGVRPSTTSPAAWTRRIGRSPEPVPGVDEDEHDDDRHDRRGEDVVRQRQAREEGAEQEIAVAPLRPPDERPVEDGRDEEEMEPVHLRERRLEPELAGDRQRRGRRRAR